MDKAVIFEGVDLEDSWVLGWHNDSPNSQLIFNLEVSLWPGHEHYVFPLPSEYTCYKLGCLIFEDVIGIEGLLPMSGVRGTVDADGSKDYGNIEGLHYAGRGIYKFGGDFGEVSVECRNLRLEIGKTADSTV